MDDTSKNEYLNAMGIDVWKERYPSQPEAATQQTASSKNRSVFWMELENTVKSCTKCDLHASRTNAVFGVGNPDTAEIMIIGEAPGQQEDLRGEPFVGRAGQLLNSMLHAIGLSRDTVFIGNILKCRPPKNRDPSPEEVATCTPYLLEQIDHIKPKLIVALGRIAAQFLLDTKTPISQLRREEHVYHNTPLIVTYHPAYLLRSPGEKAKSWMDLITIYNKCKTIGQ